MMLQKLINSLKNNNKTKKYYIECYNKFIHSWKDKNIIKLVVTITTLYFTLSSAFAKESKEYKPKCEAVSLGGMYTKEGEPIAAANETVLEQMLTERTKQEGLKNSRHNIVLRMDAKIIKI